MSELDEVSRKILEPGSGTSIFDPVVCELMYRWFCPPGGSVLDPFAGGSVRGVVAAVLGHPYTGVELRPDQVAANEVQWAEIAGRPFEADRFPVKVSAASARLRFHGCDPEYIRTTCHAACCRSTTSPTGTLVTIHPTERAAIEGRGGVVEGGLLRPRPGERRCPFEADDHLCRLHGTSDKPFGCIASPFTLNDNGTLIVRNRYKSLRCYDAGPRLPAYRAFRASLDLIFGVEEATRICDHLEAGGDDLTAWMPAAIRRILVDNDAIKHGRSADGPDGAVAPGPTDRPAPRWIVGDARDLTSLVPGTCDLVFTCPPYADLERYSDDPRDLSTLDYPEFLAAYRSIIAAAVGMLRPNRFAAFVVGDVRDGRGFYRNFPAHTIEAFEAAGARLYNDAILVTAVGSLSIRVGRQFASGRKLGKTHQNVLVFYKGDPGQIRVDFPAGVPFADVPDDGDSAP